MWPPALATQPVPIICTFGRMNLIMSWMLSPDSTCPPCELIITRIGSLFSSASASSWATVLCATFWVISPKRMIVRALNRLSVILEGGGAAGVSAGFSSSPRGARVVIVDLSFGQCRAIAAEVLSPEGPEWQRRGGRTSSGSRLLRGRFFFPDGAEAAAAGGLDDEDVPGLH